MAALALLILALDCAPCLARQVWNEQQLEQWIFQNDQNATGARKRLDSRLTLHLEDLNRACKLTEEQNKKLKLAGRGDIKRFFDRYETLKRKFKPINQNQPNFQEEWQKMWQDISPLQTTLQAGLFREDSLFHKSVYNTLTTEQRTSYDALERERRQYRVRANIELTVSNLEQMAPLRDEQRQKLITLMTNEIKLPRVSGPYDYYYVQWQLSKIPEEKVKPLFDDAQRKALNQFLNQARAMELTLKQAGQLPADEEVPEKPGAVPPAAKK
ncbi:MAG TPA: SIMPL domain-containing protein [Gemmataceae bacterium]|jgi:hypothetical protein|nr:SIMPL domain-containing protein [Gemmataceae bacterium]